MTVASAKCPLLLGRLLGMASRRRFPTTGVVFGEDACPVRDKIAACNLSTMWGMALHLLQGDPIKGSLKSK